jgi:dipeptidyl aminopeptidase/acylaminoacyl peptidase
MGKIFYRKIFRIREQLVFAMTGYALKKDKKKVREINDLNSPIYYVKETTVPTIIFHGTKDNVVPVSQSQQLKKALDAAFVPNELIIVKDGDHGFNNQSNEILDKLIDQSIAFIKTQQK